MDSNYISSPQIDHKYPIANFPLRANDDVWHFCL